MKYDWVISLGSSCQAAYQIRHHFSQEQAFTFDWLITRYDGLLKCLNNGMRDLLDPKHLVESDVGASVENTKFGILHVHDFENSPKVRDPDWRMNIDRVQSKYNYLADRWNKVVSEKSRILFVRHSGHVLDNWNDTKKLTVKEANMLCKAIERAAPNCKFDVAFVNALEQNEPVDKPNSIISNILHPIKHILAPTLDNRASIFEIDYTDTTEWPDENDWWRGPSSQWLSVFQSMQSVAVNTQSAKYQS